MNSLVSLQLNNNTLATLDPGIFDDLHSIVLLSLYENIITKLSARLFTNLHSLKDIEFGSNKIASLDEDMFSSLHSIRALYLGNNALVTLSSKIFYSLYLLQVLFLDHVDSNQIKHFEDDMFSNLSKLTHLSLAHNHLSFLSFNLFDYLLNLTHLNLSDNRFHDITRIDHMIFLTYIDLLGNPLTKITHNMFSGVPVTATVLVDKPEVCFCYLNESDTCFYTTKPSPYLTCNRTVIVSVSIKCV